MAGFFEGVRDVIRRPAGMVDVSIFNSKLIGRSFVRGGGRLRNLIPAHHVAHDFILEEFLRNFNSEGSYASGGWAALAESTVRQKQALGLDNGILVRHGRLRGSLTEKGHPDQRVVMTRSKFELSSDVEYGGYHQDGTSTMPARPQQLTESARKQVTSIYTRHFAGVL